jgi:hypothetical protein
MAKATAVLDLAKRPAMVMHVNPRLERHGDDGVLACDIKLDGIHLEPDELNLLLGDKHAHAALFIKPDGKGKAAEPMFRQLKSFELVDKFENCAATISLGLSDNELEFDDVKVAKVKLSPQVGGQTLVELTVQTVIEDTDDVARLLEHLESECNVALMFGSKEKPKDRKAQKELGLGPTAKPDDKASTSPPEVTH